MSQRKASRHPSRMSRGRACVPSGAVRDRGRYTPLRVFARMSSRQIAVDSHRIMGRRVPPLGLDWKGTPCGRRGREHAVLDPKRAVAEYLRYYGLHTMNEDVALGSSGPDTESPSSMVSSESLPTSGLRQHVTSFQRQSTSSVSQMALDTPLFSRRIMREIVSP